MVAINTHFLSSFVFQLCLDSTYLLIGHESGCQERQLLSDELLQESDAVYVHLCEHITELLLC